MKNKRKMTLIEVIAALVVISLIFYVYQIKMLPAIRSYRFKTDCDKVFDKMRECHQSAIMNNGDLFLTFIQEEKGIRCYMGSDEWHGLSPREPVRKSFFKDLILYYDNKAVGKLSILFSSTGAIRPNGTLILISEKLKEERIFNLAEFAKQRKASRKDLL